MSALKPPDETPPSDAGTDTCRPNVGPEVWAGAVIIILFFAGFLGWVVLAPLESAAIASGTVTVDGNRKTVQHLEGGIVDAILVRDGDRIAGGQTLIRLVDTAPRATLDLLRGRWMVASALEARLIAERDGHGKIGFPEDLAKWRQDAKLAKIVQGQINIFDSRRNVLAGQAGILEQRVAQYAAEITGIRGQIRAEDVQDKLIAEEISGVRILFEKGFAPKPRLLRLQRRAAEIQGTRNLHLAQIARAEQSIAESRMRVAELKTNMLNEVVGQLRTVGSELLDLNQRLRAAEDVLRRTRIRAPIAGTVVGLRVHTTGGVVAPGEPLLDIVPSESRLVVEAKVSPQDIDIVRVGLAAEVRFTAFNQRHRAPAAGTVTLVSADHLIDETSGESYYLARVELAEDPARSGDANQLYPGMQAEVMIVTGERTALEYLMEPLSRSLRRAFREN